MGTHTYAVLEVSSAAFNEISGKLSAFGYGEAFMPGGEIDMHGLAIRPEGDVSTLPPLPKADPVPALISPQFATELTPEASAIVDDMFEYHKWTPGQVDRGAAVRKALADAVKVIIANVPPSPDRTTAIRKLREARMDANSAITHRGRY